MPSFRTSAVAMLVAAAALAHVPAAFAAEPPRVDVLPFRATETTLPNGLKVIVVPTGFPNLVSIQVPVQTGSRNEVEAGKSGFAHFFEHMMFRGTPRYPPERFSQVMAKAGARNNAYTTDDYTNYHATFAREDLESVIEMLGDNFQNLAYDEAAFKTESRAVLGEYNKSSAEPSFKLFEAMREAAFTTHTYRHTTMGFLRDIEDMPNQYEYSKQFFDRWYRPENAAVIVAGDVAPEEVLPLVRKYWGNWKRGSYSAAIPSEPAAAGPKYVHVSWNAPTNPLITVAFHNPPFSETNSDHAALDMAATLWFGPTSDLYRDLVIDEQKADFVTARNTNNADPELFRIQARVKKPADVAYVRDRILATVARARNELVPAQRLADAKSEKRYAFVRRLDNTDAIAGTLAAFVRYRRAYASVNNAYRLYEGLTPEILRANARKYFTDGGMVVATLSHEPLAAEVATLPRIAPLTATVALAGGTALAPRSAIDAKIDAESRRATAATEALAAAGGAPPIAAITQKSALPQLRVKMAFAAGSADDPAGKEGLAALSAAMIAGAGSKVLTTAEQQQALYPMAGALDLQVDKELTAFTATVHKDNWRRFLHIVMPQLVNPGFGEEDFRRLKDAQKVALVQTLRSNNEEELGKERLQMNLFTGTPYGHPVLGTVVGIEAITLDDVRQFVRARYTRNALRLGMSGDVPAGMDPALQGYLAELPAGAAPAPPAKIVGTRPAGMTVEIIQKETRATAISFGLPIEVTRSHPDFAALSVWRSWLGEHRSQSGRLFNRIREVRGMNYGDYAYIEAFPRAMALFFPDPNIPRRAQIFEVWLRPVVPENAHMALRIATHELQKALDNGPSQEEFAASRDYLMKNVYLMTATQDQRLGYALDSQWYGLSEYTQHMRDQLSKLTLEQVNQAARRHLSGADLSVVIVTKDAEGLRDALIADAPSTIRYDAPKPQALLDEDRVIGARRLGIAPERIRITPVAEVFAK